MITKEQLEEWFERINRDKEPASHGWLNVRSRTERAMFEAGAEFAIFQLRERLRELEPPKAQPKPSLAQVVEQPERVIAKMSYSSFGELTGYSWRCTCGVRLAASSGDLSACCARCGNVWELNVARAEAVRG